MQSTVVIHSVVDGTEDVLFETDALIEAPNWSRCGTFLVVNGGGRLYRLPLDAPSLSPIDTGSCTSCNNDHGISPDGTQLVISDGSAGKGSCIYTLPIGGGTPVRITQQTPSYWHGWSPDGKTLAYVGKRAGVFHVITILAEGGAETVLTDGSGHRDGPDYSPDGEWIWFNSDHHGKTPDIWKMRTDGGDLTQVTDDAFVNWFPHPSPDGAHVLYLAYPPDTQGHPRGKDVTLNLMSPDGTNLRRIAAFHGGQGSINVPNWSPDGEKFAYVRYAAANSS
ncbi:WD40-like Beta Propeller Repeat [Cognatiyoonia koreensis]|uniref:WD40-like Beta Propeller Repeat n=1 Tax=Cognatiyoonia koreensis TaxID=364200 RepID=A0A1I0P452_9RHOB|nr:TolB family protein [Cognatiyoonia koreensis]SEW08810.1 WD40-like Beta Propeller Repeat [Cognatiyoonia koreensis]